MAIALVQSAGSTRSGSGATHTQAFGSNVVAGNLLVVCAAMWAKDAGPSSVTDSQGNTYTRRVSEITSAVVTSAIYTATAGSSGACTVTLTPVGGSTFMAMAIAEVSGWSSIGNSNHAVGAGTQPSSGNVTTSAEAVLFGSLRNALATTYTPGAGWTTIYEDGSLTNVPNAHIYRVETSAGTWAATWTLSATNWTDVALAILGSGGAAAAKSRRTLSALGTRTGSRQIQHG